MMVKIVAPALRALLARLIDYAGIFPPATLSRDQAITNYISYGKAEHAWMLRWLVINAADLEYVPGELYGSLSVVSDADEARAACLETKRIIKSERPVYCEVSVPELDEVKQAGCLAKIRTGGLKQEAIPPVEDVAAFILACADRQLPFKATAGLHHPIRALQPLNYEADAPRAQMHGFLNVLMAAAFAWHGERDIEPILSETDIGAFRFDEGGHWKDKSLNLAQIQEARLNFVHAIGSCSFDEPVQDLRTLELF